MPRRFQFSLGTLLACVVAFGAIVGFVVVSVQKEMLRRQAESFSNVPGTLKIKDRNRAWIRSDDGGFPNSWNFRIFVPTIGRYRIGVQTRNVLRDKVDRTEATYYPVRFDNSLAGILLGVRLVKFDAKTGRIDMEIPSSFNEGEPLSLSLPITLDQNGFDGWNFQSHLGETLIGDNESVSFDVNQPTVLVNEKSLALSRQPDGSGLDHVASSKPGPGVKVWFERDPE